MGSVPQRQPLMQRRQRLGVVARVVASVVAVDAVAQAAVPVAEEDAVDKVAALQRLRVLVKQTTSSAIRSGAKD